MFHRAFQDCCCARNGLVVLLRPSCPQRAAAVSSPIPKRELIMSGPGPQERKHGRTPNSTSTGSSDWREYDDAPFEHGPPMPNPPGRRKAWNEMAVELWESASTMPHCADWRREDWLALRILMTEVERYYAAKDEDKTTAQMTEIRRQKAALGIGDQARVQLRIRYRQRVEPGQDGDGPDGSREVLDDSVTRPAGKLLSMKDRRSAITSRAAGGGQADTATG
jgi:hypothetical protein